MWLSLFLFVWCCLCWTKTRNWSLERPKSKVKKNLETAKPLWLRPPLDFLLLLESFIAIFLRQEAKKYEIFLVTFTVKKMSVGMYVFMKFWGHFTQNYWGQMLYINVCCILWFHWHIYVCVQQKDFFYIESTSLVTNWET